MHALLLFLALAPLPPQATVASPDQQAILAPIYALFQGMTARDAAVIKAAALPGTSMVLMRDGKPLQITVDNFADRVARPSPVHVEERIHDPLIHIDNDLAIVWAPFGFYQDGKLDHCGTDVFQLVRVNNAWRIAAIADTSRNTCPGK